MKYQILLFDGEPIHITYDQATQIAEKMQDGAKHIQLENRMIAVANIKDIQEIPSIQQLSAPEAIERPMTESRRKWYKILKINKDNMAKAKDPHAKIGIIRDFEELEHYDQTGELPAYRRPDVVRSKTIVVDENSKPIGWRYTHNSYGEYMTKNQAAAAEVYPMSSF